MENFDQQHQGGRGISNVLGSALPQRWGVRRGTGPQEEVPVQH